VNVHNGKVGIISLMATVDRGRKGSNFAATVNVLNEWSLK